MTEVPEGAGTRPGRAAPTALPRWNLLVGEPGSVRPNPHAVRIGFSSNAERPTYSDGTRLKSRISTTGDDPTDHRKRGRAEARPPTGGRRRAPSANRRESAGAAGSGGSPPTRKPERQREARPGRPRTSGGAVAVEFATKAHGCGALGCRVESPVYRVEKESGAERVLCEQHTRGWLGQ
jgi:hypothetical protein